jgi:hypothetical protein
VAADVDAGRIPPRHAVPARAGRHLHIGHAKSIALNFGIAERFGGRNLRFDDTNPEKEEQGTSTRSRPTSGGSATSGQRSSRVGGSSTSGPST